MQSGMHNTNMHVYRTKAKQKVLRPSISNYVQSLTWFYLRDSAPQHSFKRNNEKTTLKDEGVRLDLLGLYGVGLGRPNESRETVQVTCTLEVPRWASRDVPSPRQLA